MSDVEHSKILGFSCLFIINEKTFYAEIPKVLQPSLLATIDIL